MFSNPLIRRYRFSQFRPQQLWTFGIVYICVIALTLFININIYRYGRAYSDIPAMFKSLFIQFSIFEIIIAWLLMPYNSSSIITKEITEKTFEFFRLLPVSAFQKATGILIGRNLFSLMLSVCTLCLIIIFGILGLIPLMLLGQLLLGFICITFAINTLTLLSSVLSFKKAKNNSSVLIIILFAIFVVAPLIGALANALERDSLHKSYVSFFTIEIPVLLLISGYATYIAVWAFAGVIRRFTLEYEPLFSPWRAVLFLITLYIMLYALFYKAIQSDTDAPVMAMCYWIVCLIPLEVLPFFSLQGFDKYLERTRKAQTSRNLFGHIFLRANPAMAVVLFSIWFVNCALTGCLAGIELLPFVLPAAVLFTFFLVVMMGLEVYVTYSPRNEKIGYLIGFLGGLYFVLPLILAGIFDAEAVSILSPIGFVIYSGNHIDTIGSSCLAPAVFNLLLLILTGMPVFKQYKNLASARTQLQSV